MKLTESALAKIELGNRSEVQYRDDKVTGFAVRVRKLGNGSIRRDFLVMWQERAPNGRLISNNQEVLHRAARQALDARGCKS